MSTDYPKLAARMLRLLMGVCTMCLMATSYAQGLNRMALLLPDGLATTESSVTAWMDAAQEQGFALQLVRNADLLIQGPGIVSKYAGLIVPDQIQVTMSDALVTTLKNYVAQGGNLLLVYDAGALTAAGFYAVPKSRFSDLVGVDYVLYDQLLDRTVGLGPVNGLVSTLRSLQVPPGKSVPYAPATATTIAARADSLVVRVADTGTVPSTPRGTAEFLPVDPKNPGGLARHDHAQYFQSLRSPRPLGGRSELRPDGKRAVHKDAVQRDAVPRVTPMELSRGALKLASRAGPGVSRLSPKNLALRVQQSLPADEPVHSVSGYVYGALQYPSFVTQGTAQGAVLMASPQHGLVASSRTVGSGSVLFVNLPLTYLKLSEDAMPLHGFLHLFARGLLKQPRLTGVPNGTGGLVFNWHLDSNGALAPMQTLKDMGVWLHKPFSIDMTAGPDTIVPGDKLGIDLPNNLIAQQFLKDFVAIGHEVGSHGGWIHDYYGGNANETNAAEFLNYLVLNRNAIEATIGRPIMEYSAPEGNNPLWSLQWMVQNGVRAYYTLSHTGTAITRSYRSGRPVFPSLWAVPVTPLGVAATFEEFNDLDVPEVLLNQWYTDLIDFVSTQETNRQIYAHPPGAVLYPAVLKNLLAYAKQKQLAGQFRWYTSAQLASFMTTRAQTTWDSAVASNGRMRVTASHPTNLSTLTWAFAKNRYAQPTVLTGKIKVIDQGSNWLVRVTSGRSAAFEAAFL